jgi:hypothetical protein
MPKWPPAAFKSASEESSTVDKRQQREPRGAYSPACNKETRRRVRELLATIEWLAERLSALTQDKLCAIHRACL